jgi:hypothetical protein
LELQALIIISRVCSRGDNLRISEKTIEINFCAELKNEIEKRNFKSLWFGLTQMEEARFGFDSCVRLGGKLLIFQFKAATCCDGKVFRYIAPHEQMKTLREFAVKRENIFYVLPGIYKSSELLQSQSLLRFCRLVPVSKFPNPLPNPISLIKQRFIQ